MEIADRLSIFAHRTDNDLCFDPETFRNRPSRALRSGRDTGDAIEGQFPRAEAKDLGDRMHILSWRFERAE